jgi:uncharacterized protein YkwD
VSFWLDLINNIIDVFRPKPKPPAPPPNPPPSPPTNEIQQLLTAHNQERSKAGARSLVLNSQLNNAAQKHANWMAANRKLSHDQNGVTLAMRLKAEGYQFWSAGENIAMGQTSVQSVMSAWMRSSGHRANILKSGYMEVGFGIAMADGRRYWCANFGSRSQASGFAAHEPEVFLSGPLELEEETLAIDHLT